VSACFEVAVPRIGPPEDDQQLLDLLVLVLGVVVLVGHPDLRPDRVEHRLLRERVDGQLEGDLVDQDTAVAAAGLQVLELPVDDRVVVGDQVVDVAGLGRVLQGHGSLPRDRGHGAWSRRIPQDGALTLTRSRGATNRFRSRVNSAPSRPLPRGTTS